MPPRISEGRPTETIPAPRRPVFTNSAGPRARFHMVTLFRETYGGRVRQPLARSVRFRNLYGTVYLILVRVDDIATVACRAAPS